LEKTISASARKKKSVDRLVYMQLVHYKELTSVLIGVLGGLAPAGAFGRNIRRWKAAFAPSEKACGGRWQRAGE
jgi:hypothetical protein